MGGERGEVGMAVREGLVAEARRGAALLAELLGRPQELVGVRTAGRISAARDEVIRLLDRREITVALMGDRSDDGLLDQWVGQPLFAGEEPGAATRRPVITLRRGAELAYRARTRSGRVHEGRGGVDATAPDAPAGFWARLRRLWARLMALLSRRPALPSSPKGAPELVRELRERLERGGPDPIVELSVLSPEPVLEPDVVIVDARGMDGHGAPQLASGADACLLALGHLPSAGPRLSALAELVRDSFPHVLVFARGARASEAARALGVDAARVCVWSPENGGLGDLARNERALSVSARCAAAIRLAVSAIDDALARDADVDRRELETMASHGIDEPAAWRAAALASVAGGCAGRTVRILERTASVVAEEMARLEAECMAAVDSAGSRREIQEHVAAVDPALQTMREAVEMRAAMLATRACAELVPELRADLESRVERLSQHIGHAEVRPAWPPAPRFDSTTASLLASDTLQRADLLRVDLKWSDALLLRSLESIKERSKEQLAVQLQGLGRNAWAEVMRSEPAVAQRLLDELGAWLDAAAAELARWIGEVVERERQAREAARHRKHAGVLEERARLMACATRLASGGRSVSQWSHRLCAGRGESQSPEPEF